MMNSRVQTIVRSAEGRYFTAQERRELLAYAASVPQRLEVTEQLERLEDTLLAAVTDEVKRRHPEFATHREQPWARLYRDLQLVLRTASQALVSADLAQFEERVLYWLHSIATVSRVPPAFQRECYTLLRDECQNRLTEKSYELLAPMLERAIAVLASSASRAQSA